MKFKTIDILKGIKTESDAALPTDVNLGQLSSLLASAKEVSPLLNINTGIAVVNIDGRLKMVGLRLINQETQDDR